MNISCISCPARYGVPDAKLSGKRVRITCKRCGTVLLVDGTMNPPRVSSGAGAGPSVAPVARTSLPPTSSPAAAPKVEFLVVMADDRQESADVAQIVRLYRDRVINAETLVWKDGMAEWQTVWEVADIAAAFRRMGYARPSQPTPSQPAQASYDDGVDDVATHVAPSSRPPAVAPAPAMFDEDEATSVVDSSRIALEAEQALGGAGWRRATEEDDAPTGVVPSPLELGMAPRAASRAVERRSDRPATRATARSDRPREAARAAPAPEPTPSPAPAPAQKSRAQMREDSRARQQSLDIFSQQARREAQQELAPAVEDDAAKLTGARGENSVLFSLDQLIKQEQQGTRPLVMQQRARTDESVLVDSSPSLPSGVGGSALAAPDFTRPVSAPPPQMAQALGSDFDYPAPKRSKSWLVPVFLLLFVGLVGGAWAGGFLNPLLAAAGLPIGAPSAAPSAEPAASAAPEPSAKEASAESSAAPEASGAPGASASASAAPSAAPVATGKGRATTPKENAAAQPGEPTPKEPETKPAAAGGAEFDAASAKTALTAAANNAASCKESGGPTGSGKVSITFAPSGRPTSVAVTGELAGTTVGSCVAKLFRAARVPAFSGDPVSVSKSFSVQ